MRRLSDKPFALLGINSDEDLAVLKDVLEKERITWPSWQNGSGDERISAKWNIQGRPTIYVLDAEGVIRYKGVRGEGMDKAVDTLLAELETKSKN